MRVPSWGALCAKASVLITMPVESVQVVEDARNALWQVRQSLADLYASLAVDPHEPQAVARQFQLNRNLTWKLSRVLRSSEPLAVLHHLPGAGGIELALKAFEDAGADKGAVQQLRTALAHWQRVIEEHAGDRDHLELMLESMGLFERDATSISGRELAFRGNSSVWGLRCSARTSFTVITPSQFASKLDFAIVSSIAGLQRLRPGVKWRLYRAQVHDDKGDMLSDAMRVESFERQRPGDPPMMLRDLCSPNVPDLLATPTPDGVEIALPGGEVGKRAEFDCSFGYVFRSLPLHRTEKNDYASTALMLTIPSELVVFDVALHKSVQFASLPEIALYGFPHGGSESPALQTEDNRLPMKERLTELSALPAGLGLPQAQHIEDVAKFVFGHLQLDHRQFRVHRLQMSFPPMSTRLVLRWRLPEA